MSAPYELYLGDCLDVMPRLEADSIDMVLCDLPYGTTRCKWDTIVPLEKLWAAYDHVAKGAAAIVLNGAQPFTSVLITSNLPDFKYCWVWDKSVSTGFLNAKLRPLVRHEDIVVFQKKCGTYNPQMVPGRPRMKGGRVDKSGQVYGAAPASAMFSEQYHPTSVLDVSNANRNNRVHPTQKPVPLLEYLIHTYTNKGDTVLDNTMGSGSTGVACVNTGRKFVGIEKDENYFAIAQRRIAEAYELSLKNAPSGG